MEDQYRKLSRIPGKPEGIGRVENLLRTRAGFRAIPVSPEAPVGLAIDCFSGLLCFATLRCGSSRLTTNLDVTGISSNPLRDKKLIPDAEWFSESNAWGYYLL